MSPLEFYATEDGSLAILGDVMERCGVWVVPNRSPYEQPEVATFSEIDNVLRAAIANRSELLWGGSFSKNPPRFNVHESGAAAGKYYISLLEGGPLVQARLPGIMDSNGERILVLGSVILQRYYRNPATGAHEPPSPELKKAFREIVKVVKQHLTVHALAMKFWIGPEALRLFKAGAVAIKDVGVVGTNVS
jgi:hypothetical protein